MYFGNLISTRSISSVLIILTTIATLSSSTLAAIDIRTVALTGDPVPGTPDGTTFLTIASGSRPVISNSGKVAFRGAALGISAGIFNFPGIWVENGGTLELVALENLHAPGTGAGVNFQFLGSPQLDAAGHLSFASALIGAGVDSTNNTGIWSNTGGSLELVVREGGQAPDLATGVQFVSVSDSAGLSGHRTNIAGQTMFEAIVAGPGIDFDNNTRIWVDDLGTLTLHRPGIDPPIHTLFPGTGPPLTVQEGDLAPGILPVMEFAGISNPVTNSAGQNVFRAFLLEPGASSSSNTSIWIEDDNGLHLIAREGEQAPGMDPGVNFNILTQFNSLNAKSQIAFKSDVQGPGIHGENNRGIWIDTNGTLDLIVRTGTQAPGTNPGVDFVGFDALGINDRGSLVFGGTLTGTGVDGTNDRGIWLSIDDTLQLIAREGDQLEVAPGDTRTISSLIFESTNEDNGTKSGFNDSSHLVFAATFTDGSTGVFVATPEPATAVLCLGGLAPCLLARRRTAG